MIATDQVDPHDRTKGIDPTKQALVTIDAELPSAVNVLPAESGLNIPVSGQTGRCGWFRSWHV